LIQTVLDNPIRLFNFRNSTLINFYTMKRSFVYVLIATIGVSVSSCASKNTSSGPDGAVPAYEFLDLPKVKLKDFRKNSDRSEEHTSELQSRENLVCRLLLE